MAEPSRLRLASVRISAIAAASLTAAIIFVPMVTGAGKSAASISCGGEKNAVEAEFVIDRPSDIWKVFPAMLRAPELEEDTEPARVVVFKDGYDLNSMMSAPGKIPPVNGVVCVVQADGTVNLYDSVSAAGAKYP